MFCGKCGNEIKGGAFCGKCGAKVTDSVLQNATLIQTPSTTQTTATQNPFQLNGLKKNIIAIAVLLFAAIAVVFGIMKVSDTIRIEKEQAAIRAEEAAIRKEEDAIRDVLNNYCETFESRNLNGLQAYFVNYEDNMPFGNEIRGFLSGAADLFNYTMKCDMIISDIMLSSERDEASVELEWDITVSWYSQKSDTILEMVKINGVWLIDDWQNV